MRLGYKNILEVATVTATGQDANYPIANVFHKWKRKIFQTTTTTSTVTITFTEAYNIDTLFIAHHNLTDLSVLFYDSADALIDTWTPTVRNTISHYESETDIFKVELSLTSADTIYIGGIFLGESIQANITAGQDIPLASSDVPTFSSDGQVSGRKGSVTRAGSITIPLLTATERQEIEEVFYTCGTSEPFWLDLWDLSPVSFSPIYGVIMGDFQSRHEEEGDTVSFEFREVN